MTDNSRRRRHSGKRAAGKKDVAHVQPRNGGQGDRLRRSGVGADHEQLTDPLRQ
jgi:hypothetical protein